MQKITFLAAFVFVTGFNFNINATDIDDLDDLKEEKCYCIAFAGQNDGKRPDKDNLPDKSTQDNDCDYWKYVPSGTCVEIGGSLIAGQASAKNK